jgi:zinc protease
MGTRSMLLKSGLSAALLTMLLCVAGYTQPPGQPKQEKLLNGLKVLMWPDAKADKVYVTIRVHSGAAFDPQGKEGLMKMLAANFFPLASAGEFFTEDLGGSLDIDTTYDYIQLDASAQPESLLTLMETLASAVSNPPIDKETTDRLKARLLEDAIKRSECPSCVADDAVAARLFGTFPYGRPIGGTQGSIKKIEYADLIGAKQRFLTADNSTIVIAGNFDRALTMRALRRYFGSWLKSDRRVPSTFTQPETPPAGLLTIPSPQPGVAELRFALRGVARSDKDLAASMVFAKVLENRLRSRVPAGHSDDVFVRSEPHTLPGIISIGFKAEKASGEKHEANDLIAKALADPVTDAELQSARTAIKTVWSARPAQDAWLDADTYQIANLEADRRIPDAVTLAEVNALAGRLRQQPIAAVLVNTPAK